MSEQEKDVLHTIEERLVDFYDDKITAALVEVSGTKQIYVPLRPICNHLGLDWSAQTRRIQRDEVLRATQGVAIMATPSGEQKMLCLPLEMLPGWLFGIEASRVKPELKEKILRYQRECFKVLWDAFQTEVERTNTRNDTTDTAQVHDVFYTDYAVAEAELEKHLAEQLPSSGELALLQIREMGLSIARMAEQQLEIEREVKHAHSRLDLARDFVRTLQIRLGAAEQRMGATEGKFNNLDDRLERVEDRLSPPQGYITDDQAATVATEVKALAELLTTRDATSDSPEAFGDGKSKKPASNQKKPQNFYANIFAELYRRFGVSTYKLIRLNQYPVVLQFLGDWKKAADEGVSNEIFLQGRLF